MQRTADSTRPARPEELLAQVERLLAEREQLVAEREQLVAERERYRDLYLRMLEQCRKLELGILGQKSERLAHHELQMSLSLLSTLLGEQSPEGANPSSSDNGAAASADPTSADPTGANAQEAKSERSKPTGRKTPPEHLPRVDIEVLPPEVEREGTDAFERIGTEVSETVERRRASLVVVRVSRGKFVRKDRIRNAETEVLTALPPDLPIERGLAGPGLLADTIVRRWEEHQPLARMEQSFAREGYGLDRSTICTWHIKLGELIEPLSNAMWQDARRAPYLCTDATGVLVQAPDRCRHGHFFVVVAPERHVLYEYTPKHDGAAVDRILAGYTGYLVADAHAVYDHLYVTGKVIEVGCWAHTRRYFFKSLESDAELARQALAIIGALFGVERTIADAPPGKRRSVRQQQSRPLVEQFFAWCDAQAPAALDQTPLARAIGYARNQRQALSRFLDDERLPLDNNISERALRREAVGRKNWLFVGNDDAGQVNARFVSLLASCRMHGIEPYGYLRDLFCLLPTWPRNRVLELAPAYWNKTLQQQDTQQRLAANIFRRVSLDSSEPHRNDK